jgi:hypothetical protein
MRNSRRGPERDIQVELANADYEMHIGSGLTITMMERHWKLQPGQLKNYRANHLSRTGELGVGSGRYALST